MTGAVLAIDQGTSGTKAIVVDPEDGLLAAVQVPVRPLYLPGGRVEQDPEQLLESVLDAGRQALAAAARPVETVSLANQGETVLAWDPLTGQPLTEAIVWQDGRAATICAQLSQHRQAVAQQTGLVLDPYFSAPKMAWIRHNLTTAGVVTTSDSWLLHQLTGEFVTDVSTASRSLLMDLDTVEWNAGLLDLFDLADERLPRLAACDETVGTTTVFGSEMTLAGVIVDQQAALLAATLLGSRDREMHLRDRCFSAGEHRAERSEVDGRTDHIGGLADRWQQSTTASTGRSSRSLPPFVGSPRSAWFPAPDRIDSMIPADAGGVLCVPALAGLAAPWWRPEATATFTGITLSTAAGHLIFAVLQGIAAQVAALTDSIATDLGAPLTALRVDGGSHQERRADAGGGGPDPAAPGGLSIRARHGARRRSPRPSRPATGIGCFGGRPGLVRVADLSTALVR